MMKSVVLQMLILSLSGVFVFTWAKPTGQLTTDHMNIIEEQMMNSPHSLSKRSLELGEEASNPVSNDEVRAARVPRNSDQDGDYNSNRAKRQVVKGGGLAYGITPLRPGMNLEKSGHYAAGIGFGERTVVQLPQGYRPQGPIVNPPAFVPPQGAAYPQQYQVGR